MPSADFWDYAAIPHLQGASGSLLGFRGDIALWQYRCPRIPFLSKSVCPSLLEQADSSLYFRNTYTLLPTVTYTFAIPLG